MANSRFDGKVVIVTGGARGIGRAIVESFAREGAKVGIGHSGRSEDAAQQIIRNIGKDRAVSLPGDVADAGAVKAILDKTISTFGRLDILVNNAGICPFRDVLDVTVEEFDRVQAVNTRSIFLMSQGAARFMKDHGGGVIVNITSISGERFTDPQQLAYCTSKAAANMLTRGLAVTLAPYGIRVNAVLPGTIPTDINQDVLARPGVADAIIRQTPLKCLGECSDVAAATLFLAGDEAKWITGTLMVVDGGVIA
ncbi:MAG TPA: SDR family oxidoreductase [Phycisphaerae bacterium]|nr:SDR family oxidoreductase [Phycisphaerae bacterium]HRR86399.1 SDR family oxidoreductase [Phycisphaerae bacterium]